jgi:hypothetical protein
LKSVSSSIVDRLIASAYSFLERLDLLFEAADLYVSGIAGVAGLEALIDFRLEFFTQVGVGAAAIEGGAVNRAAAASVLTSHRPPGGMSPRSNRSIAARMRASFCLRCSAVIRMVYASLSSVSAASISARTRWARSWSACSRALSVLRVTPRLRRNVLVVAACCAQIGRWQG